MMSVFDYGLRGVDAIPPRGAETLLGGAAIRVALGAADLLLIEPDLLDGDGLLVHGDAVLVQGDRSVALGNLAVAQACSLFL